MFSIPKLENTATNWDEATIWIHSIYNLTTLYQTYSEVQINEDNLSQTEDSFTVTLKRGFIADPRFVTDPSNLELKVYTPEGTVIFENFSPSGVHRIDTSSTPPFAVTQAGIYKFKITNVGRGIWNGFLKINLQISHFERPYYYWRFTGFLIAIGYIGLSITMTLKKEAK